MLSSKKIILIPLGVLVSGLLASFVGLRPATSAESCVNIYFDQGSKNSIREQNYSRELINLVEKIYVHEIRVSSVNEYVEGGLDRCDASFYIGSVLDNKIPNAFLSDFITTKKNVVWMGYNIWQLGRDLEHQMGLRFLRLFPKQGGAESGRFFFQETFEGRQKQQKLDFTRSSEPANEKSFLVELVPTDFSKFEFLAEIRHSSSREVIPYAIIAGNRFYFADNVLAQVQDLDPYNFFDHVLQEMILGPSSSLPKYGVR